VVGALAWERLSPEARARVQALLGGESLAAISTWADSVRPIRRETAPLHYVNIPIWEAGYDPGRHCPEGRCVVAAITRYRIQLADPAASTAVRGEALRFLVHFVQDLHQPLHAGDRSDRGGNDVPVRLGARETNLHALWDTDVVRAVAPDDQSLRERLAARLAAVPPDSLAAWRSGDPAAWAMEGQRLARQRVYALLPPDGVIGSAYVAAAREVVETQLVKAVVRLAMVLEEALGRDG
jgi:hypothetical protein